MLKSEATNFQLIVRRSGSAWLGQITYRYRKLVILVWVICVGLSLLLTPYLDRACPSASNDLDTRALVQALRAKSLTDLDIQVAGQTASELDTIQVVYQRLPLVLTAMMTVTFLALCVLLNSIILPLKAMALRSQYSLMPR